VLEELPKRSDQLRGVTSTAADSPRSGDKPVDSVDNTVNVLSPRVTKSPNEGLDTPQTNFHPAGEPHTGTERDNPVGPNVNSSPQSVDPQASGRDLVRAALEGAREKAKARGVEPGVRPIRSAGAKGGTGSQSPRRRRWSGPGADQRDPQPFGRIASRIAGERGWNASLANGQVFGQWARLVGEDVAEHALPIALKEGELTVRASSTAWATQLRLLQGQLLLKIAAVVGHGVVKRMRIQGPTAPSWRKGYRHVSGRGPRDTYG
jgi:predicted nucleic acid-binding Zn ribbon protein